MTTTLAKLTAAAALALGAATASAAAPQWDATGSYVIDMEYLGTDYAHDMTLSQDSDGDISGSGGSPAGGAHTYTWVITSGSVDGNTLEFHANYTAAADAVVPQTTLHVVATIESDGSLTGTWSDNYQGGSRSGSLESTSGAADQLGSLVAEDFGVVNYDTGLGILKGYSAGFGLDDATFEDAQSVVVKLYASSTLLQTNTATAKLGDEITGSQISSPFDVSGNFDYATDGFWVNVREAEYGETLAATRVVATVTLENGLVVTAENTILAGDPTSIMPTTTEPIAKDQCKNGGWKLFTNPSFKNQGQCVKHFNSAN